VVTQVKEMLSFSHTILPHVSDVTLWHIIIIIYLSWSWATCWPIPVSHIQKSFERSTVSPSARWELVFHYPEYLWNIYVINTVGSHFTTGLRSRIFGCKSNRRKRRTVYIVEIEIGSWANRISRFYNLQYFFTLWHTVLIWWISYIENYTDN
jgi:hypothetical protein